MIKRIFLLIALILISPLSFATEEKVNEEEIVINEGEHYEILDREFIKDRFTKVYSVYCKSCYIYDYIFTDMEKHFNKKMDVQAIHIFGSGKFRYYPSLYLEAVDKSKKEELKQAMFKAIHDEKVKYLSDFNDYLIDEGFFTKEKIEEIKKDKDLLKKVKENEEKGLEFARISGIPSIIINNKYLVNLRKMTSSDMMNLLIEKLSTDIKKSSI